MFEDGLLDADSVARRLLAALGREVSSSPGYLAVSGLPPVRVVPSTVSEDWAGSGAVPLTGSPHHPVLHYIGRPATLAKGAALAFAALTGVLVDGPALLGERGALMDLPGGGRTSAGGSTRLLPCSDGWWALNLAQDKDLVAALTECHLRDGDEWTAVARWGASRRGSEILDRTRALGMASGILGECDPPATPWRITSTNAQVGGRSRPVVVNLGALWAAPLAGNLLSLADYDVIDIESSARPDPSRRAATAFYAHLHAGSTLHTMDFGDEHALRSMVASADIVIEASRPRAFAALGIDPRRILGDGRARTWIRITGHADRDRVAFGDDAAVAGGLVAWDCEGPVFCGDAVADPLTGLIAALVVAGIHSRDRSSVVAINLSAVSAHCGRSINYPEVPGPHISRPHVASRERGWTRPSLQEANR